LKLEILLPRSKEMQLRDRLETLIEEMLDGQILLDEALAEFEKLYIQKALKRQDEHLSRTSAALGIHRNTLAKRLACYREQDKKTARRKAAR
jgi:DNA-binding NtrC family response regulator